MDGTDGMDGMDGMDGRREAGDGATGVAIVTGAAGGVGAALVELLVARGRAVVAVDVAPEVEALAGRVSAPGAIAALVGDVASSATARLAVERAHERFGRLDLLVNNAARFLRKPLEECTDEDFDRLVAVNLRGAFAHSRAAVGSLAATRGSIVNVTSISGLVGLPGQSLYGMTKGALVQLTRQMAVELAPRGVRVNAVAPGAVDTDFMAEARRGDPDPAATAAEVASRHPLGRISTPAEVAEAVAFLGSAAAGAITGEILSVDGGYVAQ